MKKPLSLTILGGILVWLLSFGPAYAQEVTILFTGETHAMIYPCNCPKEPDGGIARRATLIKKIKKSNPNILLVDSGGFFGGGLMDEYTQNTQLDMQRTAINLKAMALMQYDCVAVGNDEFNFGREFLEQAIKTSSVVFLSCNVSPQLPASKEGSVFAGQSQQLRPFIVKEIAGVRIGIIGLTSLSAAKKVTGLSFADLRISLQQTIEELRKQRVDLVVLLGQLSEQEEIILTKEVQGIDVLILSSSRSKVEPATKVGNTLLVRSTWQGRKLGKLTVTLKNKKVVNYNIEEIRLSSEIQNDSEILVFLPRCFSDFQCSNNGFSGTCVEPGSMKAACIYGQSAKISLLVIEPKSCIGCSTERITSFLKSVFPGLAPSYLYYPGSKAEKLMSSLNIKSLPAFLLGREIEREKGFDALKENLELRGEFYLAKPAFAGMSFLPLRKKISGRLDLFISLFDKDVAQLLDNIREFNPVVHFLVTEEKDGTLSAAKGSPEVEEDLRAVCVQKYYPEKSFDYIACRAKNNTSSWWEDCLQGVSAETVRACAKAQEGITLLKENSRLSRDLEVMLGPTYLLNNQDIFSSQGVPSREEYKRIFSKR